MSIPELSKSQIDKLGSRLRKGDINEDDLRLLDSYRRLFTAAYEEVVGRIRNELGLEPTGRPAKSTTSISEKLRRESIRLSQIQDIAGCRIIVADILTQDEVVGRLSQLFVGSIVVDRRERPSNGYRAVHVIVAHSGKLIEVQVRTALQHLWAELSEKLSDVVDNAIKYGGGDEQVVTILRIMSDNINVQEVGESELLRTLSENRQDKSVEELDQENTKRQDILKQKFAIVTALNAIGEVLPRLKGKKNVISD